MQHRAAPSPSVITADVAVVGAGLSGLVAASALVRGGASVIVLEARDRVGGKLFTPELAGVPIDLGAHWIGARHQRVDALARAQGFAPEPQRLAGRHVTSIGGVRRLRRGETPLLPLREAAETGLAIARLEFERRRIDPAEPWAARYAEALDAITLGRWMHRLHSDSARAAFTISVRTMFGVDPSEVSLLTVLAFAQAGGGLPYLVRFRGGAQHAHLPLGTQSLAAVLAQELGEAVRLGSPVESIAHGPAGVELRAGAVSVRAEAAVIALSPFLAGRIAFDPALPPARMALARGMPMGAYFKAILGYESAWWREEGLSGVAMSDRGPVQMVVDVGPPQGPGLLAAFVTGGPARAFGRLNPLERRGAVTSAVADLLGPRALAIDAYRDLDWTTEPWSEGAPVGVPRPGILSRFGAGLRDPIGPLHWAGTDAALDAPGYMEGAIEAGERAAGAVLAQAGVVVARPR